jgi:hypothetical protein
MFSGGGKVTAEGIEALHGLIGLRLLAPRFGTSPSSLVRLFAALPSLDEARMSFKQFEAMEIHPLLSSRSLRRCELLVDVLTPDLIRELASHDQMSEYSIIGNIRDRGVYEELVRGFPKTRVNIWTHFTLRYRSNIE